MTDVAHIDFETLSAADLKRTGAPKYAAHPSTDAMCLGIGWNDEPARVMGIRHKLSFLDYPSLVASHADWLRLLEHVQRGGLCVAHNAPFELAIWNNVGVRKYGWPELKSTQMDCTMARAYAMSLPGSLDGASAAVGLIAQKDLKGHRLMLKMSQPKTQNGDVYTWHDEPDQIERLFQYCKTDIEVERALDHRLAKLSPNEKRIWQLDYEINHRGIKVDLVSVEKARQIVEAESERLDEKMRLATKQEVATCNANVSLKKWIHSLGVETKGVAKDDVALLLARKDLPPAVRDAVSVRQEAAKSSTSKLATMLDRAGNDQRLRGMFQYYGANTGRWAARGVQLHNLPRPKIKQAEIETVFAAFETLSVHDCCEWMECFLGAPMSIISDCLRGFLVAPLGQNLIAVDFSAVEARVLAWLAGQDDVLDVFRTHGKIYEHQAALIYRAAIEAITKDDPRRQVGKAAVLGFGFGGGVGAIQKICKSVGITLEPLFDGLWKIAGEETRDRVIKRYKGEVTKARHKAEKLGVPIVGHPLGISKKEWAASELVKIAYRKSNPKIVNFWKKIEDAAICAVLMPGEVYSVHQPEEELPDIFYVMAGSFLMCKLPSGRRIYYPYPKVSSEKTDWGADKPTLTYKYEDATTRKWIRGKTYGGSLTENVVQAVARDLLADRMLVVNEDHHIVLHVHDEIVVESTSFEPEKTLKELEQIVSQVPAWASGLPMAAEGWYGRRYRK